jgi:hypothetical protein
VALSRQWNRSADQEKLEPEIRIRLQRMRSNGQAFKAGTQESFLGVPLLQIIFPTSPIPAFLIKYVLHGK